MALANSHLWGIQIGFTDSLERNLTRTVNGLNLVDDDDSSLQGYDPTSALTQLLGMYRIGSELQATGTRTLIRKTQYL